MKLLIDTNVILDVLLKREPFCDSARDVLAMSARQDVREYISASAVTDIYYIAHRQLKDRAAVRELLKRLLELVSVAGVSEREIRTALDLGWRDFEDSVQYAVALYETMDGIVTRNTEDYQGSNIKIWDPKSLLNAINRD